MFFKMKQLFNAILLLIIIMCSCNVSDTKMQGGWLIESAYYRNKPVRYDLLSNSFELNNDHSCWLPVPPGTELHTANENGMWSTYKSHDTLYLRIETINKIFNRTFSVTNYRVVDDNLKGGMITKATLVSDSLKFECYKASY